jgi:hypothetical protein
MAKSYLGDSVYAEVENGMIKLTTENGLPTDPSNTIYLELEVYDNLVRFVEELKGAVKHPVV